MSAQSRRGPDPERPSRASPRKVPACASADDYLATRVASRRKTGDLLGKQRAHRLFVGDPRHRLGKKLSAGKLPYALARTRFVGKGNRVSDDDFIELRFGYARHGAAGQH